MPEHAILELKPEGLYCAAGDFYVDPWRPVKRAIITHAHADHARPGMKHYLVSNDGMPLFQARLGYDASLQGLNYGERIALGDAKVSLHPAGHVLGSAQVRVETSDGSVGHSINAGFEFTRTGVDHAHECGICRWFRVVQPLSGGGGKAGDGQCNQCEFVHWELLWVQHSRFGESVLSRVREIR